MGVPPGTPGGRRQKFIRLLFSLGFLGPPWGPGGARGTPKKYQKVYVYRSFFFPNRADDDPSRQQAYCSLWMDLRQIESDSMMFCTEAHTFGFLFPHKREVVEMLAMKITHSGRAMIEDLPHYWELVRENHLRLELIPLVEVHT